MCLTLSRSLKARYLSLCAYMQVNQVCGCEAVWFKPDVREHF